ncbi:MAG: carbon-nitrogen hydrolase family protein [Desulfobacterales bacterium]|nr:carbon-nitrogen hydrolase family protein [Desulfobacterales bacterium]
MKISIYQGEGNQKNVDENLNCIRKCALSAAQQGADLIVFPELFLTGYNIGDAAIELAEPQDGPSSKIVSEIAREADISIIYGYPEKSGPDRHVSALFIESQGRLRANYRKNHLYGDYEKSIYKQGDTFIVVRLKGITIGILICYDVEFPEAVRTLAKAGAELIVVPTALMEPYSQVPEHVIPSRAYENQVFVAYVNRCGSEKELDYTGLSCVCGPDGKTLVRAGRDEGLYFADINSASIDEIKGDYSILSELRPELYNAQVKKY